MDIEDLIEHEPRKIPEKPKKPFGGFKLTQKEQDFIRQNYTKMTDKQIGDALGRTWRSIESYREKNKLKKAQGQPSKFKGVGPKKNRNAFIATLDDEDKRRFLSRELSYKPMYQEFTKAYKNKPNCIRLYKQKYLEFAMDPTVETVTSMEWDIWHEMTLAQIREMEYLRRENDERGVNRDGVEIELNFAKEIAECQKVIQKCQESLNVERRQRLKTNSDQAISFTQVIKELRHPDMRRKAGESACMLKYIAEKHYNTHVGTNIISGSNTGFDLGILFKDGKEPEGLNGDFEGEKEIKQEPSDNTNESKKGSTLYAD